MFDPGKVRAVIFDLDDTLRFNHPHAHYFFSDFARAQGLQVGENALHNAFRWAHTYWATSEELLADLQTHNGYEDGFWQNYTRRHLASLGAAPAQVDQLAPRVHEHMHAHYKPESRLAPGAREVLAGLRANGYLVGVLTNRTKPIYQEIYDLNLDLHLDFFLTGGQVGAFKPHTRLFEQVLDLIKVPAEESIYVGDNYPADILGAKSANIQPILFDPLGLYPDTTAPAIKDLGEIFDLLEIQALQDA